MNLSKHPQDVRNKYWLSKSVFATKLTFVFVAALSLQSVAKTKNTDIKLSNSKITAFDIEDEQAANIVVKGRVVDEKGEGLPGVSVKIKGTTNGTVSDVNGDFSINAPENATLIFSFIGYEAQEVAVNSRTTINVKMASASRSLNEVVVTALGIKKDEKKLGYSVTTVGGDDLNKAKETNVALSLEGRVAGLQVSGTNGGPGSSARILLRGVTSLTGAGSPLFVINGVPMDNTQRGSSGEWGGADYGDGISNLNPDDIESMTVLKGQSASALYGSRAANGVILITTKGGKKNSNFGVEYNVNLQFDKARNDLDFQQVYGQGQLGEKPVSVTDALNSGSLAWGAKLDGTSVIQFDGKEHPYSAVNNNALSFYNTGRTFTNSVALTGGTEKGSYRLSLSDANNKAIVPNSGLDRKTINFNTTQSVTPKLDVTVIANYINDAEKNKSSLSDGPGNPNNVLFLAPNEDQKILYPGYGANGVETQFTNDNYVTNPYFAAYKFVSNTNRQRLIGSLSAKYNFTSWVYAQLRMGYDNINDKRTDITPTGTGYNSQGTMDQINGRILEINYDALIGVKHNLIKNLLDLDFSGGASIRKHIDDGTTINGGGTNFIIPYYYAISNLPSHPGTVNYDQIQTNSAYYTADFSIKDYLVLSTTGRYDTYSTLPSANRGIFSPSVSGSFIFSDLYHMNGVDFGKFRLSYAQTSGDPGQAYKDAVYYSLANTINGTPAATFSSTLPNLTLKPYTLKELEAGIEMKFWGDRLGFDVAVFHRQTHNEILPASIDPSSGYSSYYVGTGSDQNNGLELEIHGSPVRTTTFSWTPSFNITYVNNKVLHTDLANDNLSGGTFRPLNGAVTQYVVGYAGPQIMAADYLRNSAGQIIYDSNGLPEKTALKPMGSTIPKVYGGLNNSFTYKQFNLAFLIDYRYGNKILSSTAYYSIYRGENKLTLPGREGGVVGQGVTEAGTPNTVNQPAQTYYQALAQRISSLDVLDGRFIKLRQVTFGYTIGANTLQHTPFSTINVSLVGRNLWTIMKRSDNIDPESGFASSVGYAGIEGTSLPAVRTFGFNVNFKFKN